MDTRKIFSVSEVTKDIRSLLEDNFPALWVTGEISNYKLSVAGHAYLTLKDQDSQIAAVMFRGSHRLLKFQLEDGLKVIIHGRISVYEPRGQYQLIVDYAEPSGLGALQLAFEQLKKKLEAQGLFDKRHKKKIPFLPRCVGLITSSQGAAIHDMQTVLRRRFPNIDIVIYPVQVQGEGSGDEISHAIDEMNRLHHVDVLIVGRGGGSIEDLWAFNEEQVVCAIFNSKIPVISAVGHETDFTLADYVADLRAPTPSAAAELAVPEKEELVQRIKDDQETLMYLMTQHLHSFQEQLSFYKRCLKDPRRILEDLKIKIDDWGLRLVQAQKNLLKHFWHSYKEMILCLPDPRIKINEHCIHLMGLKKQLQNLSPFAPLKRGYSILFKKESKVPVYSNSQVVEGEPLKVRLHEGELEVKVVSKEQFDRAG